MPSVIGIALFGSRARADHGPASDIDLLMWTSEGPAEHFKHGLLSLSFYSREDLLERAASGDLFASHLAHEAVAVWDPRGLLEELKAAFRPQVSYEDAIVKAEDLGYFLLLNSLLVEPSLLNKRAAWVVRTILIARMLEHSQLTFSPASLIHGLQAQEAEPLLAAKDDDEIDEERLALLERFLKRFGVRGSAPVPAPDFEAHFRTTNNVFGLKTIWAAAEETYRGLYA